jgi:hypothetical protein
MNESVRKLLTPKKLFNHVVLAVFCCIVFFELNLLTDYDHRWYIYLVYTWSALLLIHLAGVLHYGKKR